MTPIEQRILAAAQKHAPSFTTVSQKNVLTIAKAASVQPVTVVRVLCNDRAAAEKVHILQHYCTSGVLVVRHNGMLVYYDLKQIMGHTQPVWFEPVPNQNANVVEQ